MKSYNHLFEKLIDDKNLETAIQNAAKHKRNRPDVAAVLEKPQLYASRVKHLLINQKYKSRVHHAVRIYDGSSKKERLIIKPKFLYDQIIQHAIIQVLVPIINKGMYPFSCGSIPDRGCHYGKRYLEKVIKRNNNSPELKYVLKLDVRHFYQSIDTSRVKAQIAKNIHDEKMLNVIFTVLDSNKALDKGNIIDMGLPIGYYTSQWFANWFLQDLDHFIKEKLHIKYYARYVDDIVIFAKNKKELYNKYREIELFLNTKGLSVKNNWKIYNFDYTNKQAKIVGFPIDYMDFKFYRNRTTVRKSILLKASRKANKISKKLKVTAYDASQLLSYYGWFKHTNTYSSFEKHIRSKVNLTEMKQLIKRRSQLCA